LNKIIVYTQAYNAEKTLRRAVDSILAQSCGDFVYYLLDNGSTDGTVDIIKEYASRDNRIIPLANKVNNVWKGDNIWKLLKTYDDDDYACWLDADDEYFPCFFEKILEFAKKYNLAIASCGSEGIDVRNGRLLWKRVQPRDMILEGEGFEKYFPDYYGSVNTLWGRLFTVAVLRDIDFGYSRSLGGWGGDTAISLQALIHADKVGIMAEALHRYYVYPNSLSNEIYPKRITADRYLFEAAGDFLMKKCGRIAPRNAAFMGYVYLNGVRGTLRLIRRSSMPLRDKLRAYFTVYSDKRMWEKNMLKMRAVRHVVDIISIFVWGKARRKSFRAKYKSQGRLPGWKDRAPRGDENCHARDKLTP
jgi:glycosyltransferase involved in cell wall biosynthesis